MNPVGIPTWLEHLIPYSVLRWGNRCRGGNLEPQCQSQDSSPGSGLPVHSSGLRPASFQPPGADLQTRALGLGVASHSVSGRGLPFILWAWPPIHSLGVAFHSVSGESLGQS